MLIEKVAKEELPPGQFKKHNLDKTVVTMTKDEAVALIAGLVKFLNEDPAKFDGNCPGFLEGLWWQNDMSFVVVPEKQYLEHLYELRKEISG